MNYYDEIKPIKNILKKLNFFEIIQTLYVIKNKDQRFLVPEVIEFIYINAVLYSSDNINKPLQNQEKLLSNLFRKVTDLEVKVSSNIFDNIEFNFFHKLALNQLKSYHNSYINQIYRYYYIFSNSLISNYIETKINISYKDFFTCAMLIHASFRETYIVNKNKFNSNRSDCINWVNISKTLEMLTLNLSQLMQHFQKDVSYDDNIFYTHNYAHVKKPILEVNNNLFCLYPEYLLNQFTAGVYYLAEIYDGGGKIINEFGRMFEKYVGKIIYKNYTNNDYFVSKEIPYKNGVNKTSDWILADNDNIIFIECKTLRLTLESKKTNPISNKNVEDIASAVLQIYKSYSAFKKGEIPELQGNENKFFIPVVVTLEEWVASVPDFHQKVFMIVKDKLNDLSIDESFLFKFNFYIRSIDDFESDLQIMKAIGFNEFFNDLSEGHILKSNYEFSHYFHNEVVELFVNPYKHLLNS